MEYHGNLYGKIGNKYFDTGKSSADFDKLKSDQTQIEKLEAEKKELLEALEKVKKWGGEFGMDYQIYKEIKSLIQKYKATPKI